MEELPTSQISARPALQSPTRGILPKNLTNTALSFDIPIGLHTWSCICPRAERVCTRPPLDDRMDIGLHTDNAALDQRADHMVDGRTWRVKIKYPTD